MEVTTQDVLNLATAFEKLQANRSLGNGCVVSSGKINKNSLCNRESYRLVFITINANR